MDWDSEKDDEQKKTKKGKNKALTAIAAVLITILVGGVIGGGIGVTTWYANKEHSKSTSTGYSFAQNGYSGNSVQALLSVPQTDSSIADICEKMEGSVVTVVTQIMTQNLFQTAQTAEGLGSGIIFDEDADHVYIVTNAHVIEDAKTVYIYYNDTQSVPAYVRGADTSADLAVLYMKRSEIPEDILAGIKIATLGDSDAIRVGELAIAIGSPEGKAFGNTVTVGSISGTQREITVDGNTLQVIQTDAAINPGNSGGALVNASAEVIGINTAKINDTDVEGMGFAIPMAVAKPIIEELLDKGSVERPVLGISEYALIPEAIADAYHVPVGLMVYEVSRGSAAADAGIRQGDIITQIDGRDITSLEIVTEILSEHEVGDTVEVTLIRNRNTHEPVKVTLTLQSQQESTDETGDFWGRSEREDSDGNRSPFTIE